MVPAKLLGPLAGSKRGKELPVRALLDLRPVPPLDSAADPCVVRHPGGPRRRPREAGMRRLVLVAIAATACGGGGAGGGVRGGAPEAPGPAGDEAQTPAATAAAFRKAGRLAS